MVKPNYAITVGSPRGNRNRSKKAKTATVASDRVNSPHNDISPVNNVKIF